MASLVEQARRDAAADILWIPEMLPRQDTIALYSHADVFVCPSVYEPFGIINLEAMACETPVVAAAVCGISEIVVDGETGTLIHFVAEGGDSPEPADAASFQRDLADAVNALLQDPSRCTAMAARKRVEDHFSWQSIARQTLQFYQHVIEKPPLHSVLTG
jgi:alpha-maltose-1-phosphate synthase